VIGKNSKLPERFAASELKKYLERITGGQFLVREAREKSKSTSNRKKLPSIVIGNSSGSRSDKKSEDDSFSITKGQEVLTISGNSPRATLFGVYWLIRQLGVSFLAPEFDYYKRLGGAEFITVNRNLSARNMLRYSHTSFCLATERHRRGGKPHGIKYSATDRLDGENGSQHTEMPCAG